MNKKRKEDYEKLLELYKSMNGIYNILKELEINNKEKSDEYINYVNLIKRLSIQTKEIAEKYPLDDYVINNYLDNIEYEMKFDFDDYIKHIKENKNFYYKRFIEDIGEIHLKKAVDEDDYQVKGSLIIGDNEIYLQDILDSMDINELQNILGDNPYKTSLLLARNRLYLYTNTLMDYILITIKDLTNEHLKNPLIRFKYNMIMFYRCLEEEFIVNPYKFTQSSLYQNALSNFYPKEINFFKDIDMTYADMIEDILYKFVVRQNDQYNSYNEAVDDILNILHLKTLASTVSNKNNVDVIKNGILKAIDMSSTDLSKQMLAFSHSLNSKLLLYKKLKINEVQ